MPRQKNLKLQLSLGLVCGLLQHPARTWSASILGHKTHK